MAQLAFSRIGAAVGRTLLPNGVQFLGTQISGSTLGRALGSHIGGALFAPTYDGPRIETLSLMESREGAGIPNIYGRMRVAGQLIWAARFQEHSSESRTAGKGSPKLRKFSYTVSFAVALCEGEAARIGQVWANGEPLDLAGLVYRFYSGSETQLPDPLIEAIEGSGNAPAYRGISYIVFEDMPLENFGNRMPQLSFEVFRAAPDEDDTANIRNLIQAVNIIPASGEFAYDTDIIRTRRFPGIEVPQNAHSMHGEADFVVSMEQLEADLPQVRRVALTVGWFGDDLRAGFCRIRPGVELREKRTVPDVWRAGGVGRADAYLISQTDEGFANYGGTPTDASIIRALRDMVARGIQPVVTPFLFMDVPPSNGLPDPYGAAEQAAFPWRGRITGSASDLPAFMGDAQPSDFRIDGEVVDYSGDPDDWGYRRFILHLAHVAKVAGGVEAFLIGSEMVAMSRVKAANDTFPFVDALARLASDVKLILGEDVNVSYAADWTEYGAFVDGADIHFPLDPLWASDAIDFIGVDWYPPMADWRDGDVHLDAEAGYKGLEDPSYLFANIAGGEAYDWYYASAQDRDAQIRTPIIDSAHGEDWIFRQKDLVNWWSNFHHARLGGVREDEPTAWLPQSKPVRLMEIGFPAADKGANSPNLFFDPKSSESFLPPYSDGTRNDLQQRRALEVALRAWQSETMVEAVFVWCWDARPFPAFPVRRDIWSDGANWTYGHWLNGRVNASELGAIVRDICLRGGVEADTSALRGMVEGYALSGVSSVRSALESLRAAYGFNIVERAGRLVFEMESEGVAEHIAMEDTVSNSVHYSRRLLDKKPGALRLTYISSDGTYAPAVIEARDASADARIGFGVSLPVVMAEPQASALAEVLLARAVKGDGAELSVPMSQLGLETGDVLVIDDKDTLWKTVEIEDRSIQRELSLIEYVVPPPGLLGTEPPSDVSDSPVYGAPELLVIDALGDAPLVAAAGNPWPGRVSVKAGSDQSNLTERADIESPALMGQVLNNGSSGPLGRWDRALRITAEVPGRQLSSISVASLLGGANQMLIETEAGWELAAFQTAELIAVDTYRLSGFLRGLQGTAPGAISNGARFVMLDTSVKPAALMGEEVGVELNWRTETSGILGDVQRHTYDARGALAYRPGHLRGQRNGTTIELSWTRRSADIHESWALPETSNAGEFLAEVWGTTEIIEGVSVSQARVTLDLPDGVSHVRVAEIGSDGRPGAYAVLSIPAGHD